MRPHTAILTLAAAALLAGACSQHSEITDSALRYLDATGRYDIGQACQYATPETAESLRQVENSIMKMVDSNYIKANTPARFRITSTTLTSDTTAAVAYHKSTPIQEFDDTLRMVKRDGRWLAQLAIQIPSVISDLGGQTSRNPDGSSTTRLNHDSIRHKIESGEIRLSIQSSSTPRTSDDAKR